MKRTNRVILLEKKGCETKVFASNLKEFYIKNPKYLEFKGQIDYKFRFAKPFILGKEKISRKTIK